MERRFSGIYSGRSSPTRVTVNGAAVSSLIHRRFLRRGLDRDSFHPCQRDRAAVEARLAFHRRILLLFVGRLDPVKGVVIAAGSRNDSLPKAIIRICSS
jgi:hypothetical protein